MSRFLESRRAARADDGVFVLPRRVGNRRIRSTVFGRGERREIGTCF